jgi:hypothetical protein
MYFFSIFVTELHILASLCLSLHLSAYRNLVIANWIFMKFGNREFHQELSAHFAFD